MNDGDIGALDHVSNCGQGNSYRLFEASLDLQTDINVCSHDVFLCLGTHHVMQLGTFVLYPKSMCLEQVNMNINAESPKAE